MHRNFPRAKIIFIWFVLSDKQSRTHKYLICNDMKQKNDQIFTVEKLEPADVWCCCLINDDYSSIKTVGNKLSCCLLYPVYYVTTTHFVNTSDNQSLSVRLARYQAGIAQSDVAVTISQLIFAQTDFNCLEVEKETFLLKTNSLSTFSGRSRVSRADGSTCSCVTVNFTF